MIEVVGNIWDHHVDGWIVIPTNGYVNVRGECVMGRGLALQAKRLFPDFAKFVGTQIKESGNQVYVASVERLLTFPVKHNWWEKADIELIRRSTLQLRGAIKREKVFMPQVGCGNGGLEWRIVRPILAWLDDRYTVVDLKGGR